MNRVLNIIIIWSLFTITNIYSNLQNREGKQRFLKTVLNFRFKHEYLIFKIDLLFLYNTIVDLKYLRDSYKLFKVE